MKLIQAAVLIALIGLSFSVGAQEAVVLEIPAGAEAGPDFDVDSATSAYVNLLTEEQRERSNAYFEGGYWLQLWGFLYGIGVAWLLLGTRLSAKMRDFAERFGRWRWLHTFLYSAQYIVIGTLLSFPHCLPGFFPRAQIRTRHADLRCMDG